MKTKKESESTDSVVLKALKERYFRLAKMERFSIDNGKKAIVNMFPKITKELDELEKSIWAEIGKQKLLAEINEDS